MERREFLAMMSVAAVGAMAPTGARSADRATTGKTIQDVIDILLAAAPRPPGPLTVDTVKTGDPSKPITGVVTTFMANVAVIEQAIAQRANLIVTHEPTFYNHHDATDWLATDAVYLAKRKLLDDHGIVTIRYHDTIHAIEPDPVIQATVDALGWTDAAVPDAPYVFEIPERSLKDIVGEVKAHLGASTVRVVGDLAQPCRRIGLLVGAPGGRAHISFLTANTVDAVIVGEIAEWETSEYVRDANRVGRPLGLIIAGHSVSESLGMQWLAGWLGARLPGVSVNYISAPAPFDYQ